MAKTRSTSQNTEKIANLAKATENHEQALREIQKHLQALKIFMQSLAEAEDKHQQCPDSRSHGILTTNNNGFNESPPAN